MSRAWLKNGRMVLKDGRAALCDECPCDTGCRYTYYVDHARDTSGDGLSWETAFKSVNDAFNSKKIRDFRLIGCAIYVKIRGDVNYFITGSYISIVLDGLIVLQPENNNSVVNGRLTGPHLIEQWAYNVAFERWVVSMDIPHAPGTFVFAMWGSAVFKNCRFTLNIILGADGQYFGALYTTNGVLTVQNCDIVVVFSGDAPKEYFQTTTFRAISTGSLHGLKVTKTTINISIPDGVIFRSFEFIGIQAKKNYVLENNNVTISWNQDKYLDGYSNFYCYAITGGYGLVASCDGRFNLNVLDVQNYKTCRFYMRTAEIPTFYNCAQYCYATGYENCDSCPELS